MKIMRVLIACEESQTVCKAFRALGHEAYSCDIIECSGGHPEWHLQQDVLPLLKMKWDLIIAHPPCTYMSKAGARWMYPKAGVLSEERYQQAMKAKDFFMQFYNCSCEHIAIENPVPLKVVNLPPHAENPALPVRRALQQGNAPLAQRTAQVAADESIHGAYALDAIEHGRFLSRRGWQPWHRSRPPHGK